MQTCLNDNIFQILFVHLVDIVHSETFEELIERLDRVITQLQENGLTK